MILIEMKLNQVLLLVISIVKHIHIFLNNKAHFANSKLFSFSFKHYLFIIIQDPTTFYYCFY